MEKNTDVFYVSHKFFKIIWPITIGFYDIRFLQKKILDLQIWLLLTSFTRIL